MKCRSRGGREHLADLFSFPIKAVGSFQQSGMTEQEEPVG